MSIELKAGYMVKTREGKYGLVVPSIYEGEEILCLSSPKGDFYCPVNSYSKMFNFVRMDEVAYRNEDSDLIKIWGLSTTTKHAALVGKEAEKRRKLLWERDDDWDNKNDPEEKDPGLDDILALLAAALMSVDD